MVLVLHFSAPTTFRGAGGLRIGRRLNYLAKGLLVIGPSDVVRWIEV